MYCPPNVTLNEIWLHQGISNCFMDTVSTAVISLYVLIFGSTQLWIYRRSGLDFSTLPKNRLYQLQIFLLLFIPFLSLLKIILQATILYDKHVYGYMIAKTTASLAMYPFSVYVLHLERRKLPLNAFRGHGLVLLGFWTLAFVAENLIFINLYSWDYWFKLKTLSDKIEMTLFILRYLSCLLIFGIGLFAPGIVPTSSINYGSLENHMHSRPTTNETNSDENASTWRNAWYKISTLAPFLWPRKNIILQLRVISCYLLLLVGRGINLCVPIYNKKIVDSVTDTPGLLRWDLVVIYVGLHFLQGGSTGSIGLLNNLAYYSWLQMEQYTNREVQLKLFNHLHGLSLGWHLERKTGEVMRVMDRGTEGLNNIVYYIFFSIIPVVIDITVAVVFFINAFNGWFGLIVFTTIILYIAATVGIAEWRTKYQRNTYLAENEQKARSVDSLLNFETVKYYGAESYEVQYYREAILKFQKEERSNIITRNILETSQNAIISGGLLAGTLLCLHMIVDEKSFTIGDYVLFASYIIQLHEPLNWLGSCYRDIQKNFVNMESMFDLLGEKPEIVDAPNAKPIMVKEGQVEFSNVSFSYSPEKSILKNISFVVPPGKTIALVGPSGAGKSTIMRLLFRFYDLTNGAIIIDGQNIKNIQQHSLRRAIGVVPQDTVLFNNKIKYNIRYGRIDAADEDVIAAAKYADIHERILTFPDGYETEVGERGLRLSGGEKQRIAIARTILKAPKIVLLDEATSALDTQTERNIQAALNRVCANRTTIIIAHRLSTVIHADEILVLKEGQIVERGRHEDLLLQNGIYHDMWGAQLRNEPEAGDT